MGYWDHFHIRAIGQIQLPLQKTCNPGRQGSQTTRFSKKSNTCAINFVNVFSRPDVGSFYVFGVHVNVFSRPDVGSFYVFGVHVNVFIRPVVGNFYVFGVHVNVFIRPDVGSFYVFGVHTASAN